MPRIHICSLARLGDTVSASRASHLVTLLTDCAQVSRPKTISPENHLVLQVSDIVEPIEGMTPPGEEHIRALIEFARSWDRRQPMVIHCFAGISRSTAAAYVLACALVPDRAEAEIAKELRRASEMATPNRLIVGIGDTLLGRQGKMVRAIEAIGRGANAVEGSPFHLSLAER